MSGRSPGRPRQCTTVPYRNRNTVWLYEPQSGLGFQREWSCACLMNKIESAEQNRIGAMITESNQKFQSGSWADADEIHAALRPPWRDNILERIKSFPCRLDGSDTRTRNVNRGLGECHRGDVARAVWKDHVHFDPDHQLRAAGLGEQGITTVNPCLAVDSQALRTAMHRNEQKPHMRVDREVAEALEHAMAVVIRKCEFRRSGDANESRRAALE